MVMEIAEIEIDPARAGEFESAIARAEPIFRAAGCLSFSLERSIEQPARYLLRVGWASVAAHMVDFRQSDGFQSWRDLAGPFFVSPPRVEHVEHVPLTAA